MATVTGRTFLWEDDEVLVAVVSRAQRLTDKITTDPEEWPVIFRAVFELASQCRVDLVQSGAPIDLGQIMRQG